MKSLSGTAQYDTWISAFKERTIDVAGLLSTVRVAPDNEKPVCLFVHGINGDFHGLVPVAYTIHDVCRAVFVDLPGHGASHIPKTDDPVGQLGAWSHGLVASLRQNGLVVSVIVGHSFGSYVVQESGIARGALLNPPFAATKLSRFGTVALKDLLPLVGGLYHYKPVMISRGHWLMHTRTSRSDAIVAWSSSHTHITAEQMKYQARLADEASKHMFVNPKALHAMTEVRVVLGTYDRIIDNSTAPLDELKGIAITWLPTDHVSVFELPEQVAKEVSALL